MSNYDFHKYKPYLANYLTDELGIDIEKKFSCLNPNHIDKNPSMKYWAEGDCRARCFSCGAQYDLFDVIKIVENLSNVKAAYFRAEELYGKDMRLKNTLQDCNLTLHSR